MIFFFFLCLKKKKVVCSAQLLFKPGKKDNEEGREEPQLCGAVGGRERERERESSPFISGS